jgi:hypothetical protein
MWTGECSTSTRGHTACCCEGCRLVPLKVGTQGHKISLRQHLKPNTGRLASSIELVMLVPPQSACTPVGENSFATPPSLTERRTGGRCRIEKSNVGRPGQSGSSRRWLCTRSEIFHAGVTSYSRPPLSRLGTCCVVSRVYDVGAHLAVCLSASVPLS